MTSNINNSYHVKTDNWPCIKVIPSLVIITSIVLALIGILAGLEIYGLYAITDFWFLFEVAAVAGFVLGAIFCCRCFCDTRKAERHQKRPRENQKEDSPTPIQHQRTKPSLSQAEQIFVSGMLAERRKDFSGAVQHYRQAWHTYGYVQAGLALAECYELGVGTTKDQNAAQQIYIHLSRNRCMEATFRLAEDAFKTGNAASGLTWLEHAISSDYDRDRASHLGLTLQLNQQAQSNINRQAVYQSMASQYAIQEKAKRHTEMVRLLLTK
jgi:hypothetical protein